MFKKFNIPFFSSTDSYLIILSFLNDSKLVSVTVHVNLVIQSDNFVILSFYI